MTGSVVIKVALKYLSDDENLGVYIASDGGGDATTHEGNYAIHPMAVHNGRARPGGFSLDREGFILAHHASAVGDFYNDIEIARVYEAEAKALVQRVTGANRVEIFDHTRRAASLDVQKQRMIREPASIVHNDYTDAPGRRWRPERCSRSSGAAASY